jgi:hypothetical protein
MRNKINKIIHEYKNNKLILIIFLKFVKIV